MKLSQVVRGVKEKEEDLQCGSEVTVKDKQAVGYNSLASAEVELDITAGATVVRKKCCELGLGTTWEHECQIFEAIATAIESGAVISIKEGK